MDEFLASTVEFSRPIPITTDCALLVWRRDFLEPMIVTMGTSLSTRSAQPVA
jgi:hypothetical protein